MGYVEHAHCQSKAITKESVLDQCYGKNVCEVLAPEDWSSTDICPGHKKGLAIKAQCEHAVTGKRAAGAHVVPSMVPVA